MEVAEQDDESSEVGTLSRIEVVLGIIFLFSLRSRCSSNKIWRVQMICSVLCSVWAVGRGGSVEP